MSLVTTAGVLVLGALPGVIIAIGLSLLLLLAVNSKPTTAILGYVPALKSFHDVKDYPDAECQDGLLIYRFEANILFFNADFFKQDVLHQINNHPGELKWVVMDASSINVVDSTAFRKAKELGEQVAAKGIEIYITHQKRNVQRFFEDEWIDNRPKAEHIYQYATIKLAVDAYKKQHG